MKLTPVQWFALWIICWILAASGFTYLIIKLGVVE